MVPRRRACGILSITVQEVSLGSPGVETIHTQAPTPHTPPLAAYFGQFSQHCNSFGHELLGNGFQSPRRARALTYAVLVTTNYQTYLERPPGADLPLKKVCNLHPMSPRPRKKRQLPEALQES